MTNDKRIEIIADAYGFEEQSRVLMEECAELTIAVNKYHRQNRKVKKYAHSKADTDVLKAAKINVVEEIADTLIMISQIVHLMSIDTNHIELAKNKKLERQMQRLEKRKDG